MAVQQTSLFAYTVTRQKLNKNQEAVLNAVKRAGRPLTNRMIARELGWEINSITPRVLELRKKYLLTEHHRGRDITGRTAIFWEVTE